MSDYGVPDEVLEVERLEIIDTLGDRAVILRQTYYPQQSLWRPPYGVALSGLPAQYLPFDFQGSGIPVDVWNLANSPERSQDFATILESLSVGIQEYRQITLPYHVRTFLGSGGLPRDSQIVVGGSISGVSGWHGGTRYQVMMLADDSTEDITLVAHCKKASA